jgi:hypothetical protein
MDFKTCLDLKVEQVVVAVALEVLVVTHPQPLVTHMV